MKKILVILMIISLCTCALISCDSDPVVSESETAEESETESVPAIEITYDSTTTGEGTDVDMSKIAAEINSKNIEDFVRTNAESDYIIFDVKDYGKIAVVVREDVAPITAKNFKFLVKSGFYNGLIFHRVMETFMIQGGGYDSDGILHYAYPITGEFDYNSIANRLEHIPGVLSLARADAYNSGSSQFFIMTSTSPHLDGAYAAFGYVLAGMDVVYEIAKCAVDNPYSNSPRPTTPVIITEAYFARYVG